MADLGGRQPGELTDLVFFLRAPVGTVVLATKSGRAALSESGNGFPGRSHQKNPMTRPVSQQGSPGRVFIYPLVSEEPGKEGRDLWNKGSEQQAAAVVSRFSARGSWRGASATAPGRPTTRGAGPACHSLRLALEFVRLLLGDVRPR